MKIITFIFYHLFFQAELSAENEKTGEIPTGDLKNLLKGLSNLDWSDLDSLNF